MTLPAEFISVSQSTQQEYSSLLGDLEDRCTIVPNGVDLAEFSPLSLSARASVRAGLGVPEGDRVVGFFGRISQDKGISELMIAHSRIVQDTGAWLVLVGAPSDARDSDFETTMRSSFRERVIFLGYRKDVSSLMGAVDVIAMPSHSETFGRVAIEGLACGTPVVATKVGGLAEILEAEFPDLLVPVGDDEALEAALRKILSVRPTENVRVQYRKRAENFNVDIIHDRLALIFRRMTLRQDRAFGRRSVGG